MPSDAERIRPPQPRSAEFITLFQRLEEESNFESHSVFSDARTDELSLKLPKNGKAPLVLARELSDKLPH